jgi:uncharacterized integral membrane protein (TIGR00698 family)
MTHLKNVSAGRWPWAASRVPEDIVGVLPGLALVASLACGSIALARIPWLQSHGIGALTLAILLGIAFGNTAYAHLAAVSQAGVSFSKQTLLRAGIVLYGFRLTFQDIAHIGLAGVAIDILVIGSTFTIAYWVGTRFLKLDRTSAMLIGAGSSICGAAAVMAADPVVRARSEQVAVAVSTVIVFGTIAMFAYPALYGLYAQHHAISALAYGVYTGSTIHEVAQVVVAGKAVGQSAADAAVVTKMVRVMLLAPFLIVLSAYLARNRRGEPSGDRTRAAVSSSKIQIPWFALAFVGMAAVHSTSLLPSALIADVLEVDNVLLTMAMAALGVTTHAGAIKTAGIKPMVLGAVLFGWLLVGGLAINLIVQHAL